MNQFKRILLATGVFVGIGFGGFGVSDSVESRLGIDSGIRVEASTSTSVKTHVVVKGDTLYGISRKYKVSVANVQKWNKLSGTSVRLGQRLVVSGGSSVSVAKPVTKSVAKPVAVKVASTSSKVSVHKVVRGDTLYGIARKYKVSVSSIQSWNKMKGTSVRVGQNLYVKKPAGSVVVKPSTGVKSDGAGLRTLDRVVVEARKHLGTRYVWGGAKPGGFDCSGYITYVLNQSGYSTSRLTADGFYRKYGHTSNPRVGDLVFFSNTYKAGISHIGIYLGNGSFIHAADNGVAIDSLNGGYWKSKFTGFRAVK